ncbi:MAG: transporter, partial [Halobacteriales archaeon]
MSVATTASLAVHLVAGAVWVGAIAFTVAAVVPAAKRGEINAAPLGAIATTLRTVSRVAAVLLLATGGHLAVAKYDIASLTGSGRGHLVVTMAVLWLATT